MKLGLFLLVLGGVGCNVDAVSRHETALLTRTEIDDLYSADGCPEIEELAASFEIESGAMLDAPGVVVYFASGVPVCATEDDDPDQEPTPEPERPDHGVVASFGDVLLD